MAGLKLICIENKPAKGCLRPAGTNFMHLASAKKASHRHPVTALCFTILVFHAG